MVNSQQLLSSLLRVKILKKKKSKQKLYAFDKKGPNLLRAVFPYSSFPKIRFDYIQEEFSFDHDIWVTDTTFRDGQQGRAPFLAGQMVALYMFLNRLGGPLGLVRQSEFFLQFKEDREAIQRCLGLNFKYPKVIGWVRTKREDLKYAKELRLDEIGVLMSVSDYHIYLKLKKDREQIKNDYLSFIRLALDEGFLPSVHLEDITRADMYGFVAPFLEEVKKISEDEKVSIKVRLCDTLGLGIPLAGVELPRSVPKLIQTIRKEVGFEPEDLEWHGHNDFHKAHINSLTAWVYGCSSINGTLLGIGERSGNSPIEALLFEYISIKGDVDSWDLSVIHEIASYFEKELGYAIQNNYPFVGDNCYATKAGIHAYGLIRNEETYSSFNSKLLLNRANINVCISKMSGASGIVHWINNRFGLKNNLKLDKNAPEVGKIFKYINTQYEDGRISEVSEDEMLSLVKQFMPDVYKPGFFKNKPKE